LNRAALGVAADDDESYCTPGWGDWEVYRSGAVTPAADLNVPGKTAASRRFGAAHPGGFAAVFCDGSVRFVRYSVSPTTWTRACVRNDNQVLNASDL
jgi:prepilin-type processing-associated H-X9-DG protein